MVVKYIVFGSGREISEWLESVQKTHDIKIVGFSKYDSDRHIFYEITEKEPPKSEKVDHNRFTNIDLV